MFYDVSKVGKNVMILILGDSRSWVATSSRKETINDSRVPSVFS